MSSILRRVVALGPAVAIVAVVAPFTAPFAALAAGGSGGDDGGGTVVLLDPGDQTNTVRLPAVVDVGHTAMFSSSQSTRGTIEEQSGPTQQIDNNLQFEGVSTVMQVDPLGGYEQRVRIEYATGSPSAQVDLGFDPSELVGLTFTYSLGNAGQLTATEFVDNGRLSDAARSLGEQLDWQSPVAFPVQSIGLGARWNWNTAIPFGTEELVIVYEYELVELDADRYVVEIGWRTDVGVDLVGAQIDGVLAGTGSVRGSLRQALDIAVATRQTRVWTSVESQGTFVLDVVDSYSFISSLINTP